MSKATESLLYTATTTAAMYQPEIYDTSSKRTDVTKGPPVQQRIHAVTHCAPLIRCKYADNKYTDNGK